MNVKIHTQGFDLTPAIKEHVYRQLHFNLANFEGQVLVAEVFLRDVNGPKGGPDKKALVCIRLSSRLNIAVERTRSDLYTAVNQVSRQAKRAVKRTLNRHRRMEKLAVRNLRQFPQI